MSRKRMVGGHLDKRTVEARAASEIRRLRRENRPGLEGLGVRVKMTRLGAGLSQSDLAYQMRGDGFPWTRNRVAVVEAGTSMVRVDELLALAGILGCSGVWLLYGDKG